MKHYLLIFLLALSLCLTVACATPSEGTGSVASTADPWERPSDDSEAPSASEWETESERESVGVTDATETERETEGEPTTETVTVTETESATESQTQTEPETAPPAFPNEAESEGTKRY